MTAHKKVRHLQWRMARWVWTLERIARLGSDDFSWTPRSWVWPEGYSREYPQWGWAMRFEERARGYRKWWERRPR